MFRILIQYSQRLAVALLAALTVGTASAQTQEKKVEKKAAAQQPASLLGVPSSSKPVERIIETEKIRVRQPLEEQGQKQGIAVGEKTGSSQKRRKEQLAARFRKRKIRAS